MFDLLGYLFIAFISVWIGIIAVIPQLAMLFLTVGVIGTVLTYFQGGSSAADAE